MPDASKGRLIAYKSLNTNVYGFWLFDVKDGDDSMIDFIESLQGSDFHNMNHSFLFCTEGFLIFVLC